MRSWHQSEYLELQKEIDRLLSTGAIVPCDPTEGQFLSDYFLAKKPDGSNRFILNLKKLNLFVETEHFKLEDLRAVCRLLEPNMFMGSIDLKEAYFLISIHKNYRKFLRFRVNSQVYEFTCLPFGLSSSPLVFTKIMKPVMNSLRLRGFLSVIYLDDILCLGETKSDCWINIQTTFNFLRGLGFIINEKKSKLNPERICKYLGFVINSAQMTIELPRKKKANLINQVCKMERKEACSIREFAQFIGLLVASCPGVEYGMIHSKSLEVAKLRALEENNSNFEKIMKIPKSIKKDLSWWKNNLEPSYKTIKSMNFVREIFSDASKTGWGAFCNGKKAYGHWTSKQSELHINQLELKAALLALKSFANDLTNREILLRIDNTTAMAYINKMGGVKVEYLHTDAEEFWNWCEERRLWVFAEYISSRENKEADTLSRIQNKDIEWELADYAFREIQVRFGNPEIDLFASKNNTKCEIYCSWERDPDAFVTNAFTLSWSNLNFYAFPPFGIIAKVLQKIKNDKASGIVVVPLWSNQIWFPVFMKLLKGSYLEFHPNANLLLSSCRTRRHPLAFKLTLVAARLSAKPSDEEEHQRMQRT